MLEDSARKAAPRCRGVRDLRVGMVRRRENIHRGGGRKPRVREMCNVAKMWWLN